MEGRVSIVTGAGQGIGRGIALRLATEGSDVVVADFNPTTGSQVSQELEKLGVKSMSVMTDVTDLAQIRALVQATMKRFGKIDVLVNDAGVVQYKPFFQISERDWDFVFEVNMRGLYFCTQEVAKEMKAKSGGSIVNISSIAAKHGSVGLSHYSASKMGVIGITRTSARELAPFKIRVNAVCPGTIITPMHFQLRKDKAAVLRAENPSGPQEVKSEFGSVPLSRDGTPEDVAAAVAFFASDDSSYITGQSLNVCGGELFD
jgi:meso-butanediol dehydrogenase / (S,S)-butanediol dehydrogenase / diacetyl reductase